jgi:indole-3-glycerol phosphate synthase
VTLLDELVASARERARRIPRVEPSSPPSGPSLAQAIRGRDRLDVVAEFKRKSPSLGDIAGPELEAQVKKYEAAGAAAISVLTEPSRFGGSFDDLAGAASAVEVPVLMKDFVVEEAQVREAARLGARGVLLISRCLSRAQLSGLVAACAHYRLTPFLECHSHEEVERALQFEQAVVGVNNRDLETLEIDRALAPRLLASVPEDRVVVAESGYESARDASEVRGRADAVLVGSALMKCLDPGTLIREIRG